MSLNRYVTSLNEMTNMFITREEVITGLSTIFSDLSGINFSSINFGVGPNPSFSTINMNPSGTIALPANVNTRALNLSTVGALQPVQAFGSGFQNLGFTSNSGTQYAIPWAAGFGAQSGTVNAASNDKMFYGPSNILGYPGAGGAAQFLMRWNSAAPAGSNFSLTNVSTINGQQVGTSVTSYTNLTGNNITNNQVIASPSIVGVSSLNALPISAYQNSNSQPWVQFTPSSSPGVVTLSSSARALALTFSNVPIPAVSGRAVNFSGKFNLSVQGGITTPVNLNAFTFIGGSIGLGGEWLCWR